MHRHDVREDYKVLLDRLFSAEVKDVALLDRDGSEPCAGEKWAVGLRIVYPGYCEAVH
jgi:hypothetical protein